MGSARQRRPSESTSASSSSTSAAAGQDQGRGPAAAGGFEEGLQAASPRSQSSSADSAEIRRLGAEMKSLAQRNAWAGVERAYKQLIELDGEIPGDVYALAAQAAESAGDVRETQMRYRKAKAAGYDADLALSGIDDNFVPTYLSTQVPRPRSDKKADKAGAPVLSIASMPFAPNARKAIEFAIKEFANTWSFNGMLPFGSYTLEHEGRTVTFEVASFSGRVQQTV